MAYQGYEGPIKSTGDLINAPERMTKVIAVSPCMVFAHSSFIGVPSYPPRLAYDLKA